MALLKMVIQSAFSGILFIAAIMMTFELF